MLSSTSLASWDLLTMTSLSLTAVCIRLTLEWSLEERTRLGGDVRRDAADELAALTA